MRMTKEQLANANIPENHKQAIEEAIRQGTNPNEPEDLNWPDYFRGEMAETLSACAWTKEEAEETLDPLEYQTECNLFSAGWMAKILALEQIKSTRHQKGNGAH